MSTGFNWFKDYKIEIIEENKFYRDVNLEYIGGGDTSHSVGNVGAVQRLIRQYSGKTIPSICADFIKSEDEKLKLIEPEEMSTICKKILDGTECDEVDGIRDRIKWFKQLSDEGYYLSYDYD